jgi:hypothetical protein
MFTTLTIQQLEAIRSFALRNGRSWKASLRAAWETGNYETSEFSSELQQVRNSFGPRWLKSFKLTTHLPRDAA